MQVKQMHAAPHPDDPVELEKKVKAQAAGFLLVPVYLLIIAWIARALGWW